MFVTCNAIQLRRETVHQFHLRMWCFSPTTQSSYASKRQTISTLLNFSIEVHQGNSNVLTCLTRLKSSENNLKPPILGGFRKVWRLSDRSDWNQTVSDDFSFLDVYSHRLSVQRSYRGYILL